MMQTIRHNQKGMTLAEILIVIALMAVGISMAGVGFSLMYSRDAEVCARHIDDGLSNLRIASMGKSGTWEMELRTDDSGNILYVRKDGNVEETVNLQTRVSITYDIGDKLNQTGSLTVGFDKANGKVKRMEFVSSSGTVTTDIPGYLTIHTVSNNGNRRAQVVLVTATGKHYIEYK